MSEIKAILLCGSSIALPVLRDLLFHQQLAAVVIPGKCADFTKQVQLLLKDSGIPVININGNNLAGIVQEAIKEYSPALGLVFAFSYKIPAAVYTMPAKGFYNIHPGTLPAYRGPDPIFQQVKNAEPHLGVSIHKLDDGYDSGPLVLSNKIRLSVSDTYGMAAKKISELASEMANTLMKMAGFDVVIPSRQQDNSKAAFYKRQAETDITIDWQTMPAASIVALINACNPWNKGAVTMLNNNVIRLLDAHCTALESGENNIPGTILSLNDNGMKVAAAEGQAMLIKMIYTEEGFLMAARLKDFGILPGTSLGP